MSDDPEVALADAERAQDVLLDAMHEMEDTLEHSLETLRRAQRLAQEAKRVRLEELARVKQALAQSEEQTDDG